MSYEIIGVDLASGPDKVTEKKIQDKIYKQFGLTAKQVETKEHEKQLLTFLEINNMK